MKDKRKRAAWVRAKLYLREMTAADISRKMQPPVTPRMVQMVIGGVKTSRRVQEAVARSLGMKFETVWGKAPHPKPPSGREEEDKG